MALSEIIAEKKWSYVMFRDGDNVLLTFLSGGSVEFDYTILLGEDEVIALSQDPGKLTAFVQSLLANPGQLASRKLPCSIWPQML
jgi:hypothetical protein